MFGMVDVTFWIRLDEINQRHPRKTFVEQKIPEDHSVQTSCPIYGQNVRHNYCFFKL